MNIRLKMICAQPFWAILSTLIVLFASLIRYLYIYVRKHLLNRIAEIQRHEVTNNTYIH